MVRVTIRVMVRVRVRGRVRVRVRNRFSVRVRVKVKVRVRHAGVRASGGPRKMRTKRGGVYAMQWLGLGPPVALGR